jgi:hypothetical protein
MVLLTRLKVAVPIFVTVKVRGALAVPTCVAGKDRMVGEMLTAGPEVD